MNNDEERRPRGPGRVRRDIHLSTLDGTLFSVMQGTSEFYFGAFVLASGFGQVSAGLVATIPLLAGALLQLVTPPAVRRLASYRRWVVLCATVQTLALASLALGAWQGSLPAWSVFAIATAYFGAGMAGSPAWFTWMSLLFPSRLRAAYLGHRMLFCQAGILAGLLGSGWALGVGTGSAHAAEVAPRAFAGLFLLAALCRAGSTITLALQHEQRPLPFAHDPVPLRRLLAETAGDGGMRGLRYAVAFGFAAQVAQPFFVPLVQAQRHVSPAVLGVLLACPIVGRMIGFPVFGRLARRLGTRGLLVPATLLLGPALLTWWSADWRVMALGQLVQGVAWSAQELGVFLVFFGHVPEEQRVSVLTKYNLINSAAIAAGSQVGALLLAGVGESARGYGAVVVTSIVLRMACAALVPREPAPLAPA